MNYSDGTLDNYLETEVLTATPQKLQLLMINGAIRYANQARHLRTQDDQVGAWEKLSRAREIVAMILANLKSDGSEIIKQVTSIYGFLFREMTEIQAHDQFERVAGVVDVLNEERITWEAICQELPEPVERPAEEEKEVTAAQAEAMLSTSEDLTENRPASPPSYGYDSHGYSSSGFSFDA